MSLQSSKIDGLVEVGAATVLEASKVVGGVEIGAKQETLEVAKIDSFTMVTAFVVQHEHIWTDQWIGPPVLL